MKVLLVANSAWNIKNFRRDLIERFICEKYRVEVLAPKDHNFLELTNLGCNCHDVILTRRGVNFFSELRTFAIMYFLIRKIKPDIILSFTVKPNLYGSLISKFLNIPIICNVSGLGSSFLTNSIFKVLMIYFYRLAFKNVAHCFFQNTFDEDLFIKKNILKKKSTSVLPGSGVDTKYFSNRAIRKKRKKNKQFTFSFIGRILKEKGIVEFLKASEKMKALYEVKCEVLGEKGISKGQRKINLILKEYAKKNVIDYKGFSSNIRNDLYVTNCVVLPSYREGTSRAILEALSMETPVIASDVPGCNNILKDEVSGLLCSPKSVDDLFVTMKKMYQLDEMTRINMGKEGRKQVMKNFPVELVVNKYINKVGEVLVKK